MRKAIFLFSVVALFTMSSFDCRGVDPPGLEEINIVNIDNDFQTSADLNVSSDIVAQPFAICPEPALKSVRTPQSAFLLVDPLEVSFPQDNVPWQNYSEYNNNLEGNSHGERIVLLRTHSSGGLPYWNNLAIMIDEYIR